MKVIVDTSIWSLALRRDGDTGDKHVKELEELIKEVRAQLIGPVRQELLSGIRTATQFRLLRNHLRSFRDLPIEAKDYELAAEYFNTARKKGIQASNTGFLIAALSTRRHMPVFTVDRDFVNLQSAIPLALHKTRS